MEDRSFERFLTHPLVHQALERLRALPRTLQYHSRDHTIDVLKEALLFASEDGLPDSDLELIAIAAAFHDFGFLERPSQNEPLGAQSAFDAMTQHGGYTAEQIESVAAMINDTALRETPDGPAQIASTRLSGYLLDGDLANFGRHDFSDRSREYLRELGQKNELEFNQWTLKFLEGHNWHTPAAYKLRNQKKLENLEHLRKLVSEKS